MLQLFAFSGFGPGERENGQIRLVRVTTGVMPAGRLDIGRRRKRSSPPAIERDRQWQNYRSRNNGALPMHTTLMHGNPSSMLRTHTL